MVDFMRLYDNLVHPEDRFVGELLALDPGETTGVCQMVTTIDGPPKIRLSQLSTVDVAKGGEAVSRLLTGQILQCVCENYKVYSWKSAQHSWAELHTPQFIGAIKTLCHQSKIPLTLQMAQEAKGFVKDDKLKEWGYYERGQKHARDASRHALYWLLFTHPKQVKLNRGRPSL